jgi:hypothetical protein
MDDVEVPVKSFIQSGGSFRVDMIGLTNRVLPNLQKHFSPLWTCFHRRYLFPTFALVFSMWSLSAITSDSGVERFVIDIVITTISVFNVGGGKQ